MIEIEALQTKEFRASTANKKVRRPDPAVWGLVPPAAYGRTFPALQKVPELQWQKKIFGNGAAGHNVPLVSRKPLEMFPGVYTFDDTFLQFIRALVESLNSEFPVDLDSDGFTRTGIHTTFDRLKCPSGYFQNPMSYTTMDNSSYRTGQLGLSVEYSPRQRAIAENVWRIVFSEAKVSSINVPKLSVGGMRRFTHDAQWKLAFVEYMMDGIDMPRMERMLDAVDKADWQTLANEFETVYATYIQKRGQLDDPDKVRKVFDLMYAVSSGEKGHILETDKKVVINGVHYPDFSAVRARVIHAGPWVINWFLQMLATPFMKSLFERFPRTFHINTKDEIVAEINGKHVFCSDVSEYDRSMSRDAIETPHRILKEFVDERVVKASWRLFTSPYYSKPLEIDGKKGVWVGDPTDWASEVFAGNRSGHAFTSLLAKVNKVIDTMFIVDKIYPVLGRERDFLEGVMPMGTVNNGDDEITWSIGEADMRVFKKHRLDVKAGHYVVKPEAGQGFSGQLLRLVGPLTYDPTPRLHTAFEKLWANERAIGGLHRQFWPVGWMTRIDSLMETEIGRKAWDIHNRLYRDIMEPRYGSLIDSLLTASSLMEFDINALSYKDKEVLVNPDKLHHKYTDDEISPEVIKEVTSKIPPNQTEKFLRRYYTGHLS